MKIVKFRILVRMPNGTERWETDEREIGSQKRVRGYGLQPEFTGFIDLWGEEIIEWFNKDAPENGHRKFIRAELVKETK